MTEEKLKTWKDLRIGEELCYRLDSDVYLPVKEELEGIDRTYTLGFRKEDFKGIIESELKRPRQEAIKWIKDFRKDMDPLHITKHAGEEYLPAERYGAIQILKQFFDISKEDLK